MSAHNGIHRFRAWLAPVLGTVFFVLINPGARAFDLGSSNSGPLWWNGVFEAGPASEDLSHILEPRSPTWGLKGPMYGAPDESANATGFDFKREVLSFADRSFLSIGLGWNELELEDGDDSSGLRFSVEGHWGIGSTWSLYGQSVWIPELEDTDDRAQMTGNGFEAGVAFRPLPNISLRAGYRAFRIDFTDGRTGIDDSASSSGVLLGAGIRF